MRRILFALPAMLLAGCAPAATTAPGEAATAEAPALSPAETLHQSLMVLDSHLDTPAYFHTAEYTFSKRGSFEADGPARFLGTRPSRPCTTAPSSRPLLVTRIWGQPPRDRHGDRLLGGGFP